MHTAAAMPPARRTQARHLAVPSSSIADGASPGAAPLRPMPTVLLTGATGYIASHAWLALQQAGFDVVGVDDFSNSSPVVLQRLLRLAPRPPVFERADVGDAAAVEAVLQRHRIDAAVHFAAFKAVGESVQRPLAYYRNNVGGLVTVCEALQRHGIRRFVFSSSATVYGDPERLPITEDAPLSATNPYGQTKLIGETLLRDLGAADPAWQTACLRYFNPVGAHPSGLIGEHPSGTPNNLVPYITQVAAGRLARLRIYGNDYPTRDGTGERDYIHVEDLARAHVAALDYASRFSGCEAINVGTGRGATVLEMIREIEAASGRKVPYEIVARREGDIATSIADVRKAERLLGWKAQYGIAEMCRSAWHWQSRNPNGYDSSHGPENHGALLEEVS